MSAPIPIALVDDHRLFRSGMASLISSFNRYEVILEAGNGQELISKLTSKIKPSIVLLDINMPHMDGMATAQWLSTHHPEVLIVVLSMSEDADNVIKMIKIGVKGYLLKDSEPQEFEQALNKVMAGELYFPEFAMRHMMSSLTGSQTGGFQLNPRELEFLKLVGTELTYKEIADQMCVSVRTVDGYRDQLFEKLQIKSRVGLALYAVKNKLIEL